VDPSSHPPLLKIILAPQTATEGSAAAAAPRTYQINLEQAQV